MDELVTTPVELDVQLNDTFEHYQVGVAVCLSDHSSTDIVSRRRPIHWVDCIHPRNACTFNVFWHLHRSFILDC